MAEVVFMCDNCGKRYVNDAVCARCGRTNSGKTISDYRAGVYTSNVRPALPRETDYFDTVRQWPEGKAPKGAK